MRTVIGGQVERYLIARAVQQLLVQQLWQLDAHRSPVRKALAQQPPSPAVHKHDNRITSTSMESTDNASAHT